MIPYVTKDLPLEDIKIFKKIKRVVEQLPDLDYGVNEKGEKILLSCHILARALAKIFLLKYVDGYFYPTCEHTWLITKDKNVIDVYPVAILGGPIIVLGSKTICPPAKFLYKVKTISNGRFNQPSFKKSVTRTIKEIKKLL